MPDKWDVRALAEERGGHLPPLLQRIYWSFRTAATEAGQDRKTADGIGLRAIANRSLVKRWISVYGKALENGLPSAEAAARAYDAAVAIFTAPRRDDARGAKEASMDVAEKRKAILKMVTDANADEIIRAYGILFPGGDDVPSAYASDARVQLVEAANKRARERNLGFMQALAEIQAERPELVERVSEIYATTGLELRKER
jgi:hypothetical protein